MKKTMTLALIAGGGALAAYLVFRKKSALNPAMPTSQPGAYQPSQPSQQYPWQPIVAPRVDNANQPWYNGSKAGMAGPSPEQSFANTLQAGGSIVHSLGDIWGDMSDWFGSSDDPSSNLMPTDDPSTSYIADTDLVGSEYDQSNTVGDMASSDDWWNFA